MVSESGMMMVALGELPDPEREISSALHGTGIMGLETPVKRVAGFTLGWRIDKPWLGSSSASFTMEVNRS